MKSFKITAIILATLLLARQVQAAPCAETDNECLLRLTLQQTNELEAERLRLGHCQRSNELLNEALKQDTKHNDHTGRVFVLGMFTGIVFVGLGATIALKALRN